MKKSKLAKKIKDLEKAVVELKNEFSQKTQKGSGPASGQAVGQTRPNESPRSVNPNRPSIVQHPFFDPLAGP